MIARWSQLARPALLTLGLAVFIWLVRRADPDAIVVHLGALGWGAALVAAPYALVVALAVLGWRYAFDRPVPLGAGRLAMIYLAGKAVNLVTPLVPVGGEPLKAYLLRARGIPLTEGLASVVVTKTLDAVAQVFFVVAATAFLVVDADVPAALVKVTLPATAASAALAGGFVLAQWRGLFGGLARLLGSVGLGRASLDVGARDLDRRIRAYYRQRRRRLVAALTFHLLSWLATSLEVWVLLALLDLPRSIGFALALAALTAAARFIAFAVPGALGVQEGATVFVFLSFGLPADAALAFSLLRRFRELVWAAAGLLGLTRLRLDPVVGPDAACAIELAPARPPRSKHSKGGAASAPGAGRMIGRAAARRSP